MEKMGARGKKVVEERFVRKGRLKRSSSTQKGITLSPVETDLYVLGHMGYQRGEGLEAFRG